MNTNQITRDYLQKVYDGPNIFGQSGGVNPSKTIVGDMPLEIRGSKRKNEEFSTPPNTKRHQHDMYAYIREDELYDEDMRLLLTSDNTPEQETMEAIKLFRDVEEILNTRY